VMPQTPRGRPEGRPEARSVLSRELPERDRSEVHH
jgi:hypothetical protein